jgi:hypothetical protein
MLGGGVHTIYALALFLSAYTSVKEKHPIQRKIISGYTALKTIDKDLLFTCYAVTFIKCIHSYVQKGAPDKFAVLKDNLVEFKKGKEKWLGEIF